MLSCRVAIVSPTDPVCVAAQKMREFRVNSVVVATGNPLQGIFTYAFNISRTLLSTIPLLTVDGV